jgi:hypothetical protein
MPGATLRPHLTYLLKQRVFRQPRAPVIAKLHMDPLAQRLASLNRQSVHEQDVDGSSLAQKRYQNDLHLKGTLDHIYEKYSRDFSEVGDEVNILTGEVIVNRGHVQRMRAETDTGIGQHSSPQTSWISHLVDERSDEEQDVEEDVEQDEEEDEDVEQDGEEEDELCICPPKRTKGIRIRDAPKEVIQPTEVRSFGYLLIW